MTSKVFNMTGGGGGVKLASIAITTPPTKVAYTPGESFDATGMSVTATYTNGATKPLTASEYTITPSGALTADTTAVTISYAEGAVTKTTTQAITVTKITVPVPTYSGSLTYNGSAQSPTISNEPSASIATKSGDTSATNAGSYTTRFTLVDTDAYQWADGSTAAYKDVAWRIAKATLSGVTVSIEGYTYGGTKSTPSLNGTVPSDATVNYYGRATASGTITLWSNVTSTTYNAGTRYCYAVLTGMQNYNDFATANASFTIAKATPSKPTLSKSSITLDNLTTSTTFTVTRDGNGAVQATSSDTSVATVSVNGNTVTVNSVNRKSGSAVITVKVAQGTNYNAYTGTDATVQVKTQFKITASTTPASGVSYTSGLSGVTQAKLSEYAGAISNNSAITKTTSTIYIDDDGGWHIKLSTGDTVQLSLGSKIYDFRIIGFNHDDLTTATAYGAATATGKAGITFQMVDCLDTLYKMNSSHTNVGGWDSCDMRTTHLPSIKGTLVASWTGIIKMVNKQTNNGSQSSTISTVSDDLFLLSEIEIFGSTTYSSEGEGDQYAYWSENNTDSARIKNANGSAVGWWERSPRNSNSSGFLLVSWAGTAGFSGAAYGNGVAFGFCV